MGLTELINEYLTLVAQGKSAHTFGIYKNSLYKFSKFSQLSDPAQITANLVNQDFVRHLNDSGLSGLTIAYNLQHLRYFLEYLKEKGVPSLEPDEVMDKMMFSHIKPNSRAYEGDTINQSEVENIINYWSNSIDSDNPRGIRNELIFRLLYDTGMTVSELAALSVDDIGWNNGTIKIRYQEKKQYKSRDLELSPKAIACLIKYFFLREDSCHSLIVGFDGWDPYISFAWPLTSRSIQRMMRETAISLGIKKAITPKMFRSTKYIELVHKGYKIDTTNKLLGLSGTSRQYQRYKNSNYPEEGKISPKEESIQKSELEDARLIEIVDRFGVGGQFLTKEFLTDIQKFIDSFNKEVKLQKDLQDNYFTATQAAKELEISQHSFDSWYKKLKPKIFKHHGKIYIPKQIILSEKSLIDDIKNNYIWTQDIAKLVKVSLTTIVKRIDKRKIPTRNYRHRVYVNKEDLEKVLPLNTILT